MSGESARVVTNREYMRVYNIVMNQCDQQDNGLKLHNLYVQVLENYLKHDALKLLNENKFRFLHAFV